jgi:transglutaminase-like putative cysteine protease
MDIASLTIALLHASQIPARYVHGTIDVSAENFKNWVGGFENIEGRLGCLFTSSHRRII